jgi:hypothetical protein
MSIDVNLYELKKHFDKEIIHDQAALKVSYLVQAEEDFELKITVFVYDNLCTDVLQKNSLSNLPSL